MEELPALYPGRPGGSGQSGSGGGGDGDRRVGRDASSARGTGGATIKCGGGDGPAGQGQGWQNDAGVPSGKQHPHGLQLPGEGIEDEAKDFERHNARQGFITGLTQDDRRVVVPRGRAMWHSET